MADMFLGRRNAREILVGLSTFLPAGYSISFPAHEYVPSVTYPPGVTGPFAAAPKPPLDFAKHCNFVASVTRAFEKDQPRLALYRELLQRFRDRDDVTVNELYLHTAAIFAAQNQSEVLNTLWRQCGCAGGCVRGKGCCHACVPAAPGA